MLTETTTQFILAGDFGSGAWVLGSMMLLLTTVMAALLAARYGTQQFGGDRKKTTFFFIGIASLIAIALLCFFGYAAMTVKGIILCLILTFSSFEDIRKRECDDYLPLMIVIAAFTGTELSMLPNMLFSAVFTIGSMLIAILITQSDIGGADIKTAAACSFLLGLHRGIIALVIGLLLAVVFQGFKQDKKKGFPMIPYLATGAMAAYFIQI